MVLVLIHVLITVVVGAILFWVIDWFVRERRLANLLKILCRTGLSRFHFAALAANDWRRILTGAVSVKN